MTDIQIFMFGCVVTGIVLASTVAILLVPARAQRDPRVFLRKRLDPQPKPQPIPVTVESE